MQSRAFILGVRGMAEVSILYIDTLDLFCYLPVVITSCWPRVFFTGRRLKTPKVLPDFIRLDPPFPSSE